MEGRSVFLVFPFQSVNRTSSPATGAPGSRGAMNWIIITRKINLKSAEVSTRMVHRSMESLHGVSQSLDTPGANIKQRKARSGGDKMVQERNPRTSDHLSSGKPYDLLLSTQEKGTPLKNAPGLPKSEHHRCARTTIRQRKTIRESNLSIRKLTQIDRVNPKTIAKWKHRSPGMDKKMGRNQNGQD